MRERLLLVGVAGAALVVAALLMGRPAPVVPAPEPPAQRFTATAYCFDRNTSSGLHVRPGAVAADLRLLPLGSVLRIEEPKEYEGQYTVMDSGGTIKGRKLDIFMANCRRARQFGKREVLVRVLRRG